ncbi:hypothetical protein GQ53DRAFT_785815 [Thozetella sp. PMI_491]|nr:hypothetical protein GQ53DRAFT_785815 [Thozetella sp. PMI_491]
MSAHSTQEAGPSPFKLSGHHCSACEVSLKTPEARRAHAKSKWHVDNLTRRVAGLPPLDPPQGDPTLPFEGPEKSDSELSASDSESDRSLEGSEDSDVPEFVVENCLFCSQSSATLEDNVTHMHKAHGLFIPDRNHLMVELSAFLQYLHLVIVGYHECLYCHSKRSSADAARQHMLGKRHCKIDVSTDGSEFLDFYDFTPAPEDGEGGESGEDDTASVESPESSSKRPIVSLTKTEDGSARLPSGKLLSHRSSPKAHQARHQSRSLVARTTPSAATERLSEEEPAIPDPSHLTRAPSNALTKQEKRENALTLQLAKLSVKDRSALAHLPLSEQRAIVARQKKEADVVRRAERRHRSRIEMMGNKNLMHHFVADTPGRKLG